MIIKREKNECSKMKLLIADLSCQTPLSEPPNQPLPGSSPQFILDMVFWGVEYPFGQFWSPVPAVLPHSFFCSPPHWWSTRKGKKFH